MKSTEKEQNLSFPTTKHKLVIAEKPSVAMGITTVIGADERKDGYMEGADFLAKYPESRKHMRSRGRKKINENAIEM